MSLLARYLIQLALVTAVFLTVWAASAHLLSPPPVLPQAGLSDGGLRDHPDGWSWNDE